MAQRKVLASSLSILTFGAGRALEVGCAPSCPTLPSTVHFSRPEGAHKKLLQGVSSTFAVPCTLGSLF